MKYCAIVWWTAWKHGHPKFDCVCADCVSQTSRTLQDLCSVRKAYFYASKFRILVSFVILPVRAGMLLSITCSSLYA